MLHGHWALRRLNLTLLHGLLHCLLLRERLLRQLLGRRRCLLVWRWHTSSWRGWILLLLHRDLLLLNLLGLLHRWRLRLLLLHLWHRLGSFGNLLLLLHWLSLRLP